MKGVVFYDSIVIKGWIAVRLSKKPTPDECCHFVPSQLTPILFGDSIMLALHLPTLATPRWKLLAMGA